MTSLMTSVDSGELVQAAFKHIDAREFDAARPLVNRALTLDPHVGVVAHVKAHLDSESRNFEEGTAFLDQFLTTHDPFDGINVHNVFHLAYMDVDLERLDAALAWYERVVGTSVVQYPRTLNSAASLLWRIHVHDEKRALPWGSLREASLKLEEADSVTRVGQAMVYIATEDKESLEGVVAALRAGDTTAVEVMVPVVHALEAFWRKDDAAAREHFEPFSGSFLRVSQYQDQRTPIEETYRAVLSHGARH